MDYSSLVPLANKPAKKKKKKKVAPQNDLNFFKQEEQKEDEDDYSKDEFTMIGAEPEIKIDSGKLPAIAKNKDMYGRSKGVINADSLFD